MEWCFLKTLCRTYGTGFIVDILFSSKCRSQFSGLLDYLVPMLSTEHNFGGQLKCSCLDVCSLKIDNPVVSTWVMVIYAFLIYNKVTVLSRSGSSDDLFGIKFRNIWMEIFKIIRMIANVLEVDCLKEMF